MSGLRTTLAAALAASACLFAAPAAGAATEVGGTCTANQLTSGRTLVQLGAGGAQLTVPSAGVLTRWQVAGVPGFGTIPQWLKVLRPVGSAFTVVDEDVGLIDGLTSHPTRIPVQAGDRVGLGADGGVFFCAGAGGASSAAVDGNVTKGSTAVFENVPSELGVPVSATLEPDADNDGWGDESQDQCPRSAELQVACPALGIDAYAVQTRGFAKVFAAPYGPGKASIAFAARVKVPASDSPTGKSLDVTWKGTRSGIQGQFTTAKLKFSRRLIEALKRPGVTLPLKIQVTATNVAGLKSTRKLTLKVR